MRPETYKIFGALFMKKAYKVRYESKYPLRGPPRALEGVCTSEGT